MSSHELESGQYNTNAHIFMFIICSYWYVHNMFIICLYLYVHIMNIFVCCCLLGNDISNVDKIISRIIIMNLHGNP